MENEICELLSIDYPIFQGGMAWIADASLAGAVSEAGGLGIIGAGNAPREKIAEEIKKIRAITDRPFGVNIMLLSPFVEEIIDLVLSEKVPVVTTGAGNPSKYMKSFKAAGIKVIPVVPSVALAKRMQKIGADAVIAEGMEAGGHIGKLTTMVLVPQIADAVQIPVIAAGGIGDGRGMAASFLLGAQGVQMGTRFLLAEECTVHPAYKEKIKNARDIDTTITSQHFGHPVRGLKNQLTQSYDRLEREELQKAAPDPSALENLGIGALRRAVVDGDVVNGAVMAGQIAGLVAEEAPARVIIQEIMEESRAVFAKGAAEW